MKRVGKWRRYNELASRCGSDAVVEVEIHESNFIRVVADGSSCLFDERRFCKRNGQHCYTVPDRGSLVVPNIASTSIARKRLILDGKYKISRMEQNANL
jgi:hypothetical protein